MWKNFVQLGRPQLTIWRMRIACWTPKTTNTFSEHVTHFFSTATMVAWTHLNVARYAHCPSCIEWTLLPTHYKVQKVTVAPEETEWHTLNDTLARTPLNRLVAETSAWQHTTFIADKHTCYRRVLNSQCQQTSDHRRRGHRNQLNLNIRSKNNLKLLFINIKKSYRVLSIYFGIKI